MSATSPRNPSIPTVTGVPGGLPFLAGLALTDRALDPFVTEKGSLPPTDWFTRPKVVGGGCVQVVGNGRPGEVGTPKLREAMKLRCGWTDPAGRPWGPAGTARSSWPPVRLDGGRPGDDPEGVVLGRDRRGHSLPVGATPVVYWRCL